MQLPKKLLLLSAAVFLYACSGNVPPAVAQEVGIQNEALKILQSTPGGSTKLATDSEGRLLDSVDTDSSASHTEDSNFSSGDVGNMCLGVKQNSSPTSHGGTSLDYTPIAVNSFGDVYIDWNLNHRENTSGASPLAAEDESVAGASAMVMAGLIRADTPANNTTTDGDASNFKANTVGALYVEPAHQVEVATVEAAIAHGSITGSYANALVNTAKLKSCIFNNSTDGIISVGDTTNAIASAIPVNTVYIIDWGANGRFMNTTIQIKFVTDPAAGTFYINCYS